MPSETQETQTKPTVNGSVTPSPNPVPTERPALAHLVLEDFVVTALLRVGRPLRNSDLFEAASGFTLSRAALREGLHGSRRVALHGRDWDLALRHAETAKARDERARKPLEASVDELLRFVGKPLPQAAIVREIAHMRGVLPELVREGIGHVLGTSRAAVQTVPGTYLHAGYVLDIGPGRDEIVVRVNNLEADAAYAELSAKSVSLAAGAVADQAAALLAEVNRPLSQKLLGYLLWKALGTNPRELAAALGDRARFYTFVGGIVTTQAQLPGWKSALQNYIGNLGQAAADALDVAALLRQRVAPSETIAPRADDLEEIKKAARATGQPVSVVSALMDTLEMEPDDPQFVPALQGLNEELRRSPEFLPAGGGRFLLRETVPGQVGEVPESLRPVQLSVRDTETDEPLDVEMSDEGLEGDAADFVHNPAWEDINEEVEVKLPRRPAGELAGNVRYIVLYPHFRAGTLKLRRQDEEFFALQGPLTRLALRFEGGETPENLAAWASRESGLIYGLGEWMPAHLPHSGGVLEFSRGENGGFNLTVATPDKLTHISETRIAELEALQERSSYLSLYDLLQSVLLEHPQGAEMPTLWAEVNTVRRTTKRLVCSVLSAYHCFYFKQRGPHQILWRFDDSKLDQGFKRNKRKYVRR